MQNVSDDLAEDAALVRAIQEGQNSGDVSREEVFAILRGLEASDKGRVSPFAEFAAEMRQKHNLPTHLSDEELFASE